MAIGKDCDSELSCDTSSNLNEEQVGFGICTRAIGRKRILVSNHMEVSPLWSPRKSRTKRQDRCRNTKSRLEALPQDLLVRVLCGADHEDLKQLFHVSKTVREAVLIAKQWHFAYSTPRRVPAFRISVDAEDLDAPDAPRQLKAFRSRLNSKKLAEISMALFKSPEEPWPSIRLLNFDAERIL